MAIPVTCPDCRVAYEVTDRLAGKKIRCKECDSVILVGGESPAHAAPPERSAALVAEAPRSARETRGPSARLDRPRRPRDADDEDSDRPSIKRGGGGLIVVLILLGVGGVLLLLLAVVGAAAYFLLVPGSPSAGPTPVAASAAPVAVEKPAPPANAPAAKAEPPAAPAAPAAPVGAVPVAADDLHSDQGGEAVLPADKAEASAPLRARKGDAFFKLSNARFGQAGFRPFPAILVDYERVHDGPFGGQSLVIRLADGRDETVPLIGGLANRAGTIELENRFGGPWAGLPKNAEFYMILQDGRWGNDFRPTFKVSTSTIMGETRFPVTFSREWTADEEARLKQPPPWKPTANAHPEAGEDTAFVGDTTTPLQVRFAEPGKPVLGFDYWALQWDNEPCLAVLNPVYEEKQPADGGQRLLAKAGYAVGGLTVRSKKFVDSVQVVFMKLTADGKLDPKDSYTSPWLGPEAAGTKEVKLGGDGRAVIGVHCYRGAILNGVALVMEKAGAK